VDKVTLDFENELVEWNTDSQKGLESCPGLAERKDNILAAMGYSMWDMSSVIGAVNSYISSEISAGEMNDIFDAELEGSQSLSFLPLMAQAIDVLNAALDTYRSYGDEAYAKGKANSFLRRCGVAPEYGLSHPLRRDVIERVVYAALDEESGELFWQNLYRQEGVCGH